MSRYGHISEEEFKVMEQRVRSGATRGTRPVMGDGHRPDSKLASSPTYRSKLEANYAAHLDLLVKAGEIRSWLYEHVSLRLADGKYYRPDFLVVLQGGLERKPEIHEVKGKIFKNRREGMVKLSWAAQKYGDVFTFRLIEWNGHGFDGRYIVA